PTRGRVTWTKLRAYRRVTGPQPGGPIRVASNIPMHALGRRPRPPPHGREVERPGPDLSMAAKSTVRIRPLHDRKSSGQDPTSAGPTGRTLGPDLHGPPEGREYLDAAPGLAHDRANLRHVLL